MTVAFLVSYYLVESIDPIAMTPSTNSNASAQLPPPEVACAPVCLLALCSRQVVCFPNQNKTSRYCATCCKNVLGLDHHCTWLNTCIGLRNYIPFLSLVVIGFVQMSMQVRPSSMPHITYTLALAFILYLPMSLVVFQVVVGVVTLVGGFSPEDTEGM
jgi:hypothetical protein